MPGRSPTSARRPSPASKPNTCCNSRWSPRPRRIWPPRPQRPVSPVQTPFAIAIWQRPVTEPSRVPSEPWPPIKKPNRQSKQPRLRLPLPASSFWSCRRTLPRRARLLLRQGPTSKLPSSISATPRSARRLTVISAIGPEEPAPMRPGQAVTVVADVLPGKLFHGHVESLAPGTGAVFSVIAPENATGNFTKIVQRVPVRIALDDGAARLGALRPGLSTTVTVDTRPGAPEGE